VLIGRESQCARLDELLDLARIGESGALAIQGEAGIGKTALLDYAAEKAEGMTVVRTLGIESEAELEFSALLDVCRSLLDQLAEIPEQHAEGLRAALELGPTVTVDRFAIGAATLGVLAAAAVSHRTVEFHLSRIYRKLDINSRAELIRRFAADGTSVVTAAS
jgi:ABC-type phosphonate transport system ATPase subunit